MSFKFKVGCAVALSVLGVSAAQANVIYNWIPGEAGQYANTTGGQMVISNRAYRAGYVSLDLNYPYMEKDPGYSDPNAPGYFYSSSAMDYGRFPNSPIVSLSLTGSSYGGAYVSPVSTYFAEVELLLTASLTINKNGTLSGGYFLNDSFTEFDSFGLGRDWNVNNLISDNSYLGADHCGSYAGRCSAGTGYWQLDPSTLPVPEPSSLGLFALALAGVAGMTYRRSRKGNIG